MLLSVTVLYSNKDNITFYIHIFSIISCITIVDKDCGFRHYMEEII